MGHTEYLFDRVRTVQPPKRRGRGKAETTPPETVGPLNRGPSLWPIDFCPADERYQMTDQLFMPRRVADLTAFFLNRLGRGNKKGGVCRALSWMPARRSVAVNQPRQHWQFDTPRRANI